MARSLEESCAFEEVMVSREAGDGAKASDSNVGVLLEAWSQAQEERLGAPVLLMFAATFRDQ
jgi:hypothetical protein